MAHEKKEKRRQSKKEEVQKQSGVKEKAEDGERSGG